MLPEFVRVAALPLGIAYRFAQRVMDLVANCVPLPKVTHGMPCDEPLIPFARQRASLLARKRDAFALAFGTNSVDASGDLSVPLAKLLLAAFAPTLARAENLAS